MKSATGPFEMLTMTNDFQVQLNMFLFKKCNVSIMVVLYV